MSAIITDSDSGIVRADNKVPDMSVHGSTENNSDIDNIKLEDGEIDGIEKRELHGGGLPVEDVPPADKDFPDLAPTKSHDFPEGSPPN